MFGIGWLDLTNAEGCIAVTNEAIKESDSVCIRAVAGVNMCFVVSIVTCTQMGCQQNARTTAVLNLWL